MRRCLDCHQLTTGTRCTPCRNAKKRRLYGPTHTDERTAWAPAVAKGTIHCAWRNCTHPDTRILPGEPWDLGHQPDGTRHPEHADCNRSHKDHT